jgi:hypothetical protein
MRTQLTNATVIPKVRKCNLAQFKNRFTEEDGRYAVDALVFTGSQSDLMQQYHDEKKLRLHRTEHGNTSNARSTRLRANMHAPRSTGGALGNLPSQNICIQRIRLQAPALLKILADIQGELWSPRPLTFIRPFSALIYFQSRMKEALRDLESRFLQEGATPAATRGHTPNPTDAGSSPRTGDEHSVDNSPAALAILRCYVDFIDREIMPLYTQFDRLGVNDNAQVRFSDLHYLFRTGELIYRQLTSDNPGQIHFRIGDIGERLWRVYGLRSCDAQYQIAPSDHRKYDVQDRGEELEAFVVRAFYLEYTGEEFCTVTKSFSILPYSGLRKVTALPIFPVRFIEGHKDLLASGIEIGDKVIHYLDAKLGSYNAWTIMKTPKGDPVHDPDGVELKHPEHINSEIMIDFAEAFQACPAWRPKRTVLKPRPAEEITESDPCPILWWSGPDRAKLIAETSEVVSVRAGVGMS